MTDTLSLSDELSLDDIDGAVAELSNVMGWDYSETYEVVRDRAGGERDPASLAFAVADVLRLAQEDGDSDSDNDGDEDVAASAVAGTFSYCPGSEEVELSYPAEPAAGWTYDAAAEAAAAAEPEVLRLTATHSRFFSPSQVADARGYLALGTTDELTGDSDYGTVEQAHVGSEVERLSMANDDPSGKGRLPKGIARIHDSDAGQPHGSNHHAGCSKACSRDHAQPAGGGTEHPEVSRLLDVIASKMGNRERPHGNTARHAPMSASELHAAQRAARPGHT